MKVAGLAQAVADRARTPGPLGAAVSSTIGSMRSLFGRASPSARPGGDFQALVLVHLDAAYNLARYLCRDEVIAEDLTQEAVLKAHRAFAAYRGGSAKGWLLTIVRREFLDWCAARRAERGVFTDSEPEEVEAAVEVGDDPEALLVRQGEVGAVRRAVEGLPEPFREAIVLRELEEMSYREISEITGVPMGTVMSRLSRGRELLASRLASAQGGGR